MRTRRKLKSDLRNHPNEHEYLPKQPKKKWAGRIVPPTFRDQDYGPETRGPVPVGTAGMTGTIVKSAGPPAAPRPSGLQVDGSSCVPGTKIDRKADEPSKE